jgi:hypothetical protein
MKTKRVIEVTAAGIVAGVFLACGSAATEQIGDVLKDAGQALKDTGAGWVADADQALVDAGTALRDSGYQVVNDAGNMLVDAGQKIKDAGDATVEDAQAQASCGTCTSGGAMRIITADTDIGQLASGLEEGISASWQERVSGPFVLVQLVPLIGSANVSETTVRGRVNAAFSDPGGCETAAGRTDLAQVDVFYNNSNGSLSHSEIQNGRFVVPAGKVLCLSSGPWMASGTGPVRFTWSGYHPYN